MSRAANPARSASTDATTTAPTAPSQPESPDLRHNPTAAEAAGSEPLPGGEATAPEARDAAGVTRRHFIAGSAAAALMTGAGQTAMAGTPGGPSAGGSSSRTASGVSGASAVEASTGSVYRIHPAIGMARVGNADPSTYFIGPEIPGQPVQGPAPGTAVPPYKVNEQLKPQAARFRIWEYTWQNGILTPMREVNLDTPGVLGIRWEVHLANKKASFHKFLGLAGETRQPGALRNAAETDRASLETDFGPRSINGRSLGPVPFSVGTSDQPELETYPTKSDGTPVIERLGELRTDSAGRLIVIGGKGIANYRTDAAPALSDYANNDDWFDDVSDGPVNATLLLSQNGVTIEVPMDDAGQSWLLVGPPDFAPQVTPSISLYDLLYDLAVREIAIPVDNALYTAGGPLARMGVLQDAYDPAASQEFPNIQPDYNREILPILNNAYKFRWVTSLVGDKHDPLLNANLSNPSSTYLQTRTSVFSYCRAPEGSVGSGGKQTMPKQWGDETTPVNPEYVRKLALTTTQFGLLRSWAAGQFAAPTGSVTPETTITPAGLDRAALENCSGGAFCPGIEVGWEIRNASIYLEPFRLNPDATSGYLGEENQSIGPGYFSRQMAVPWQADFNDCKANSGYGWWPTQRPDDVYVKSSDKLMANWARPDTRFSGGNRISTHQDMVAVWYKFGIVMQSGTTFVETERAKTVP